MEFAVQRVIIPLAGVFGVLYDTIHGHVDPVLIPAYLFMMGLAAPALVDVLKRDREKGGGS